jgi:hypothetical protein
MAMRRERDRERQVKVEVEVKGLGVKGGCTHSVLMVTSSILLLLALYC